MIDYEIKPHIIDDSGYFRGVDKDKYIDSKTTRKTSGKKSAEKKSDKKDTKDVNGDGSH